MRNIVQTIITALGVSFALLFGELNGLVIAILVFICLDYITGVLHAVYIKKLNSSIGFKGIIRKILILLVISVGHFIDLYLLGGGSVIRDACIFFYISNEGISILENVVGMGVPVPEKLKVILEQLKEEDKNE